MNKKQNYFVQYDANGEVVPMSLVKMIGWPRMKGQWKQVFSLCCDPNFEWFENLTNKQKAYLIVNKKGEPTSGPIVRKLAPSGVYTMQIPFNICCEGAPTPPVANIVTISPPLGNPGGTGFLSIPATNFGGTDASGVISFIKIYTVPTNAVTLRVNNINYTGANMGDLPNIPTNALGQPLWPIAIDPIDGAVTSVIDYFAINPSGILSVVSGTVTVPMFEKPDLTPSMYFAPTTVSVATPVVVRMTISEVAGQDMNDPTTVLLTKDPRLAFTYDPGATTIDGVAVDNAAWEYTAHPVFHIFTHNATFPANGSSVFGFEGVFDSGGATGTAGLTASISSGSTEGNSSNNNTSVTLTLVPA